MSEEENNLTQLDEIGEFGLIDRLTASFTHTQPSTIKAVGDDAAILAHGDKRLAVSTDSYVEGVHFDLVYTPLQHLGYKCIAASISDVYAMNGKATQVLVSIALSSKFTLEAVDTLYAGIYAACKAYGVDLVGGDTTTSRSGLMIAVTAIGEVDKDKITYRGGAQEHDVVVVTGDLGGAYMGLQVLEREKRVYMETPDMQPELTGYDYILRRQLRPEARKDIIEILDELKIVPSSMIDISDGLASELLHLCKNSELGCRLYEEEIPIDSNTYDTAMKFNLDPTLAALSGGEDYELLFTIKPQEYEKLRNLPDFTFVGHMTDAASGANFISKSGNTHPLKAQGWKHF